MGGLSQWGSCPSGGIVPVGGLSQWGGCPSGGLSQWGVVPVADSLYNIGREVVHINCLTLFPLFQNCTQGLPYGFSLPTDFISVRRVFSVTYSGDGMDPPLYYVLIGSSFSR